MARENDISINLLLVHPIMQNGSQSLFAKVKLGKNRGGSRGT